MSFQVEFFLQGPATEPVEALGNPVRLDVVSWGWVKFRNKDFKDVERLIGGFDNFDSHVHHTGVFSYVATFKTPLTPELIAQVGEIVETHRKQPKIKKASR